MQECLLQVGEGSSFEVVKDGDRFSSSESLVQKVCVGGAAKALIAALDAAEAAGQLEILRQSKRDEVSDSFENTSTQTLIFGPALSGFDNPLQRSHCVRSIYEDPANEFRTESFVCKIQVGLGFSE